MATGADLGIRKCLWATCGRVSTELVETDSGVVFACCSEHATIERTWAVQARTERELRLRRLICSQSNTTRTN